MYAVIEAYQIWIELAVVLLTGISIFEFFQA